MYDERKIKLLILRNSSLKKELAICKEMFQEAKREFDVIYKEKFFPELAASKEEQQKDISTKEDNNQQQGNKEKSKTFYDNQITKVEKEKKDPILKKLFKNLASETHPDKLEQKPEFEREEKHKIFKESLSALESDDIITMLEMAMKLGIELPKLTKQHFVDIDRKIKSMQKEISAMTRTYLWCWFTSEDEETKERLLNELLKKTDPRS